MVDTAAPGGGCHCVGVGWQLCCVGSRMCCVGGIHGVGVLVLMPRSWHRLPRSASVSPLCCARCCCWGYHGWWSLFMANALPNVVDIGDVDTASVLVGVIVNQPPPAIGSG
jgi:hypothetical protein